MGMQPPPQPGSTPPPPPGFGAAPPPPPGFGAAPPPPPYGGASYGAVPHSSGRAGGVHAEFGSRLGAWLLDGLLYGLLNAVFLVPGIILIVSAFGNCVSVDRGGGTSDIVCPPGEPHAGPIVGGIALIIVGVLLVVFLYVRAMGKTGQTWGARIVGVRVVDQATGAPIGFGRALGRSVFASVFSSAIFYLGYLWMLWDPEQQTWQDKVVKSVVVRT